MSKTVNPCSVAFFFITFAVVGRDFVLIRMLNE